MQHPHRRSITCLQKKQDTFNVGWVALLLLGFAMDYRLSIKAVCFMEKQNPTR